MACSLSVPVPECRLGITAAFKAGHPEYRHLPEKLEKKFASTGITGL
jgi:hypothetical protein